MYLLKESGKIRIAENMWMLLCPADVLRRQRKMWSFVFCIRLSLVSNLHGVNRHPAQHDSCLTSLKKVWAHSFSPSTMVR